MLSHFQTQMKVAPKRSFLPVGRRVLQRCASTKECGDYRNKQLTLQRSSVTHAKPLSVPPIVHEVLEAPGQPLDVQTRAFMEPRFGHDFGHVRVHTDVKAADSARAVNALAYTVGRDIVFGAGRYAPDKSEGRGLVAHELAHVLQQSGAHSTSASLRCSNES